MSNYIRGLPHNCEVIQWIPVSERLPKESDYYLVTVGDVGVAFYSHTTCIFDQTCELECQETHRVKPSAWAELPKGYQPPRQQNARLLGVNE